ncbi:FxSxx-COOH system tetratricopeptide repeat protein [Streptomyces sp. NBC_00094]|uniref:FxSxx-COOH system tetratricopeptide repeat protein n=1 Tax=Streptomyces sp. NBC_00094 TaxID=2903620 RepID=UPI00224CC66E|nr:FxSxx-COOH system tetratricopeptide repeat protein [Streptomyces sp. NBC_00094]MCX5394367.1 FxSxx-COOH system tetratricopeptide repeat protein [Streptomyces sp. NBC_00094]
MTGPAGSAGPTAREWAEAIWLAEVIGEEEGPPGPDGDSGCHDTGAAAPSGPSRPSRTTGDTAGAAGTDTHIGTDAGTGTEAGTGADSPSVADGTDRPTDPAADSATTTATATATATNPATDSSTVNVSPALGAGATGPAVPDGQVPALPRVSHTLSSGRGAVTGEELPGALRSPRNLSRALRPLNRRLPGGARRRVLDEEATAVRAAETGHWDPVLTRPPDRWFEVALVVERSVSMTVWQPVARAFAELLRMQGAFADVRLWTLDTRDGKHAVLRSADRGLRHSPAELFHPDGRRIVLLMSDCVGDAWACGAVPRLLHTWGRRAPVAVLQPLPTHLWDLCEGVPRELRVRASTPGLPNSRLELLRHGRWERPRDSDPADPLPVPVPVLELEPDWFAGWARMVTGGALPWAETTSLLVDEKGLTAHCLPPFSWEERRRPVPPDLAVRRFLQQASPAARRLAARLAMVPLRPEVVEAVRQGPTAVGGPLPFAEILLGGLLASRTTAGPGGTDEEYAFEFLDGVRSRLLRGLGRTELLRTLQETSALAGRAVGARPDLLSTVIGSREEPDADTLTDLDRELLDAAGPALSALGPPYGAVWNPVRGTTPFGPVTTGEEVTREEGPARVPVGSVPAFDASGPGRPTDDPHPGSEAGTATETATGAGAEAGAEAAQDNDTTPPNAKDTTSMEPPSAGGTAPDSTPPVTGPGTEPGGTGTTPGSGGGPGSSGQSPPGQSRSPRSVPLPNPHFAGRESELNELHRQLGSSTRAAVLPHALHGLGGVGKTQLALKYVQLHRHEYDRVWWIDAEQPAVIRAQLTMLAPELGLVPDPQSDTVARVLAALASGAPHSRWLLVFDNAGQPNEVIPYLPSLIGDSEGTGRILITSRHAGWSDRVLATKVDVFTRPESRSFLRARAPWASPEQADQLAELLGDLPLALEQCAALQRQTGIAVPDFLTMIEQRRAEVLAEGVDSITLPVAVVWRASMDALSAQTPGALELLRLLAFFGPEPVAQAFLHDARMLPLPPALMRLARDPLARGRTIRAINQFSLLTVDNVAGTVQMHRLVRAVLQDELSAQEQSDMRHLVHQVIAAHDPGDTQRPEHWRNYADILPHLEPTGLPHCDDRHIRDTAIHLISYLLARGVLRGAAQLGERISTDWRSFLGADDLQTLWATRYRASAHWQLAEFATSRPLSEEVLRRLRETVGDDHEYTLTAAGALAADLRTAGLFADAMGLDEDAYRRSVNVYGAEDPFTLRAGHNYGVSLRVNGRYGEALDLDRRVYRDRRTVLGSTAHSTLFSVNNVARDMRECGEYAAALELQEQTLAQYRAQYGDRHPHTMRAIKNMSVTCRKAGRFERARRLAEEALDLYLTIFGAQHIDSLAAFANLANDLRLTGDTEAAERQGAQAVERYREVLGAEHPLTYVAAVNHGAALRAVGKFPQGLRLDQATAPGLERALYETHPWPLLAHVNLATGMARTGDHEAARDLGARCARTLEERYGDRHPATLAALCNLSLDLVSCGEEERGTELLASVVRRYHDTLGPDHWETLSAEAGRRAECDIEPPPL